MGNEDFVWLDDLSTVKHLVTKPECSMHLSESKGHALPRTFYEHNLHFRETECAQTRHGKSREQCRGDFMSKSNHCEREELKTLS